MRATIIKKSDQFNTGHLDSDVPLGTVYDVDPASISIDFLQHKETNQVVAVPKIWVNSKLNATKQMEGWFPLEMLRLEPMTEEEFFAQGLAAGGEGADPSKMN